MSESLFGFFTVTFVFIEFDFATSLADGVGETKVNDTESRASASPNIHVKLSSLATQICLNIVFENVVPEIVANNVELIVYNVCGCNDETSMVLYTFEDGADSDSFGKEEPSRMISNLSNGIFCGLVMDIFIGKLFDTDEPCDGVGGVYVKETEDSGFVFASMQGFS